MPHLDALSLKNSLRGIRDGNAIGQVVGTIPGFVSVKVAITPSWLPPRLKALPRKAENIDIKVVATQ